MVSPAIHFHPVRAGNISLLQSFLENAGTSLSSFRYYAARPLSVISNHLVTVVITEDGQPAGYGHLDKDGDTIWLGIAVKEDRKGKGLGNSIMNYLVSAGDELQLEKICLTVDYDNTAAISLYKKFGFAEAGMINERSLKMMRLFK
jgi:ribosomal protein S18 acetylase RimI-like enzyme